MKRALIILVVVILFLLILGAVLWKAFGTVGSTPASTSTSFPTSPTAAPPTAQSPDQFTIAFYTWYLANYGNTATHDEVISARSTWLTPAFAAQVPTIIANTDADPFFLAQDAPPADSKITASVVSQSGSTSTVHVTLASSVGSITYLVHLAQVDGAWRIDSVALAS